MLTRMAYRRRVNPISHLYRLCAQRYHPRRCKMDYPLLDTFRDEVPARCGTRLACVAPI